MSIDKKMASIIAGAAVSTVFIGLSIIAKKTKPASIYTNEPRQRNALEGRKVIFIENESDKENADGVKGHLEEIGISNYSCSFYEKYIKRGIDIVFSFGGLIVLSPIMGLIALAIKIEDPGPALFTQKRIGQNKQYFKLHKFRSMKMCTPHDVPTHMLDNPDQYITNIGKLLRAHSLDELPQIWDIFIGNMSIIGPRPGLWNQDVLTAERDKYAANDVKPGLTGLAQINGRDELSIPDKAKLDGEYVSNISLKMDAKILLKSIHVFGGDDSIVEGRTGSINKPIPEVIIPKNLIVSVIMATYKREDSLRNALKSLTMQTFKSIEVVLVNDNGNTGWSSKVQSIVDEFKELLDINYIENIYNMGSAAARNEGVARAKGQYITFLDDDDVYLPEKIEMQLKNMLSTGADYSITDLYLYNEKDELIDKRIRSYIKSTDTNELMRYHLLYHMTGTDTFMFNAEYLRNIGGFPGIDVGDEFYLMKEAIANGGKFSYSNHCFVKAYIHSGEQEGLSSGESKINGENALFEEKKNYFEYLSKEDIRYIEMRHYAVIAFAEKRRKNNKAFLINAIHSLFSAPVMAIRMIAKHR